ncbi:rhomboid family intramembrane serine protease [Xenorhabdus szentirmaii]|uniref:Similar to membrane protein n=1 Tax=Xenorhabdus szentirmaii DSM 16338 TaxID=1427518 RepID=W1J3F4_9GAMM|nr:MULTISPECIES: rhomboid family intramembrane serine protease [Xenorhabdus]MBD2791396.1 rhomboid family intramembrane serine protease [Xenorhabdus sp. CUL]PHM34446.1 rhomboid family intramembrane serine protease [Xenorhabdus szentirmaii DSM 16338]PHM43175.1 rhomboid family intramembrane serine protease [Xenorhabdus szentirmaii]CDL83970.1 putative Similar to membrane protein [Xenorhabdus szentirmaii DSM 16338]
MKIWLQKRLYILIGLASIFIIIQLLDTLTYGSLNKFGIIPRYTQGLIGIPFSSFLHGSWGHLFSNLPALLVLSALLMTHSIRYYVLASLFIIFMEGILVWLFGRTAIHIGASGWIFGLWGLLLANAYFLRRAKDLFFAILVFIYYGGIALGLLPLQEDISTEGHIFGAIAGLSFSWLSKKWNMTNH